MALSGAGSIGRVRDRNIERQPQCGCGQGLDELVPEQGRANRPVLCRWLSSRSQGSANQGISAVCKRGAWKEGCLPRSGADGATDGKINERLESNLGSGKITTLLGIPSRIDEMSDFRPCCSRFLRLDEMRVKSRPQPESLDRGVADVTINRLAENEKGDGGGNDCQGEVQNSKIG